MEDEGSEADWTLSGVFMEKRSRSFSTCPPLQHLTHLPGLQDPGKRSLPLVQKPDRDFLRKETNSQTIQPMLGGTIYLVNPDYLYRSQWLI